MQPSPRPIGILMADDDSDDRLFVAEAFEDARLANRLDMVGDGEQLLAFLRRDGEYAGLAGQPLPGLVLLDLNMPKLDGREALALIRADAALRHIPVIVLTTSKAEEDLLRSYDLGVEAFIVKPVTFERLIEAVKQASAYRLEIVGSPAAAG